MGVVASTCLGVGQGTMVAVLVVVCRLEVAGNIVVLVARPLAGGQLQSPQATALLHSGETLLVAGV